MKKLTSILIVLLLIVSTITLVACDQSDELKFAELADGTYEVIGINTKGAKELTIPNEYNGMPVTAIGSGALRGCEKLQTITLPDTLKYIDNWAFKGCEDLETIIIPEGVEKIGDGAFSGCASLTEIVIPNTVTVIGDSAFYGCTSLTAIDLPDNIKSIGNSLFYMCESLTSITVPEGVESIGNGAFEKCEALATIVIPDSVEVIGSHAFDETAYCGNDENKDGGVIYIGNHLIKADTTLSGNYTVKEGTLTIAGTAFLNCKELTGITLSDDILSIGSAAFKNCDAISSVTFSQNLVILGESAFENCKGLTEISLPSSITEISDFAFKYCTNLSTVTIPEGIERIGNEAFYYCSALTGVTLPDSTTVIGNAAFSLCKSITEIEIPNNVVSIGNNAFEGSTSAGEYNALERVSFKEGESKLERIGSAAFRYCYNLSEIALPDDVKSIGKNAFQSCTSLASFRMPTGTSAIADYTFKDCTALTVMHFDDNITSIGKEAFSGCKALTSIRIHESVTTIGEKAFLNCTSIKIYCVIGEEDVPRTWHSTWNPNKNNVTWNSAPVQETADGLQYMVTSEANKTVVIIGYSGESSTVTIPGTIGGYTVVGIEDGAFANCREVTAFDIATSITTIGSGVFFNTGYYDDEENWENGVLYVGHILARVSEEFNGACVIKDGTTAIANKAFENCKSITGVVIPDNIVVGASIFSGCRNLVVYCTDTAAPSNWSQNWNDLKATVIWGILDSGSYNDYGWIKDSAGNVTIIGYSGESTELDIPAEIDGATVTTIGANAFYNCVNITSFTIPDSVLFIRENAFANTGYYNLATNWENDVLYIGKHLIKAKASITGITIKPGTIVIADSALYGCGVKTVTLADTIVSIGNKAFYGCEKWSGNGVSFTSNLQYIGSSAFEGCKRLKSVIIPASVISVGDKAFLGCSQLKIYCAANSKPASWSNNWNPDKIAVTWGYK